MRILIAINIIIEERENVQTFCSILYVLFKRALFKRKIENCVFKVEE